MNDLLGLKRLDTGLKRLDTSKRGKGGALFKKATTFVSTSESFLLKVCNNCWVRVILETQIAVYF